ncbi:MAG: hypothetical protein V1784_09915 [bacterium]
MMRFAVALTRLKSAFITMCKPQGERWRPKVGDMAAIFLLWLILIVGLSWDNYHLFTDSSYYLDSGRRFFETGRLETGVNLFQFWNGPTRQAATLYSPLLCLFVGGAWTLGHSLRFLAFIVTYIPFLILGILFFHYAAARWSRLWAYGGVAAIYLLPCVQFTSGFAGWEPTGILATLGLLILWKFSLDGKLSWAILLGLGIALLSLWAIAVPLTVSLTLLLAAPFWGRAGWTALLRMGTVALLALIAWQILCFSVYGEFYPQWRTANKTSDLFAYYGAGSFAPTEPVARISAATWIRFHETLPSNIVHLAWSLVKVIAANVGFLPVFLLAGIPHLYRRRMAEPLPFMAFLLFLVWMMAIPIALHWRPQVDMRFSLIPSLALLLSTTSLLPQLSNRIGHWSAFRRWTLLAVLGALIFLPWIQSYRWIMEPKIYGLERLRESDRQFYCDLRADLGKNDLVVMENHPRVSFHCAFFSPVVMLPFGQAQTPEYLRQFLTAYQPKRILTTCYSSNAQFLAKALDSSWQALPVFGHPDLTVWHKKSS